MRNLFSRAKCEVPIYDGSGGPEVLDSWILDMETWFDYDQTPNDKKVPFARLKLTGLAQLLVANRAASQSPITTWLQLVDALRLAFYPSSYENDLNTKWLRLFQLFNMPVKDYIYQFNRLRILLDIRDPEDQLIAKFISGLQEHLYRELKSLENISSINEAYRQAQLAEEKFLDQCKLQQHCSSNMPKSTTSNPAPSSTIGSSAFAFSTGSSSFSFTTKF